MPAEPPRSIRCSLACPSSQHPFGFELFPISGSSAPGGLALGTRFSRPQDRLPFAGHGGKSGQPGRRREILVTGWTPPFGALSFFPLFSALLSIEETRACHGQDVPAALLAVLCLRSLSSFFCPTCPSFGFHFRSLSLGGIRLQAVE